MNRNDDKFERMKEFVGTLATTENIKQIKNKFLITDIIYIYIFY